MAEPTSDQRPETAPETPPEPAAKAPLTGNEPPDASEPGPAASDPENPASETEQPDETEEDGDREAAKNRRRYMAERDRADAAEALVEALQRRDIDRLALEANIRPAALWATGVQVADLVDQAGLPDPELVGAAVQAAVKHLGLDVGRVGFSLFNGEPHPPRPESRLPDAGFLEALDPHRNR